MPTCDYNCVALPDHEQVDCGQFPKGGIFTVGVLECDHEISDFTSITETNNAIADGKLTLIKSVKASYPEATPVEGENPTACGAETILDGFDHILDLRDFNVRGENDTFYEALNQRSTFLIWYNCQEQRLRVVEQQVVWAVKPATVPESNKEKQLYVGQIKWSSGVDEFPVLSNAPTGIYD